MKRRRIPILSIAILSALALLSLSLAVAAGRAGDGQGSGQNDAQTPAGPAARPAGDYTLIDSTEPGGPLYSWVEISGTGAPHALPDDSLSGPAGLGFTFNFYSNTYTGTFLASDGYLWFDDGASHVSDPSNDCPLPNALGNENFIAAVWDDLDGQQNLPYGVGYTQPFNAGACPYPGYSGACFVAEWRGVWHDGTADDLTFEIILFDDHNFLVQLQDAGNEAGSASTIGIEDATAANGLTYACDLEDSIAANLAILFRYQAPAPSFAGAQLRGPGLVAAGEALTYTLRFTNSGSLSSTNTVLTDPLPAGTTYSPGSLFCAGGNGACTYDSLNNAVGWAGGLAVAETVTVSFAVDVAAGCGAVITNTATLADPAAGPPYTLQHLAERWDTVLFYDFEAGNGGFLANTPPGEWAWGAPLPVAGGPPAAYSGARLWATNLAGPIPAEPSTHLLTKTITLPPLTQAALRWWDWWDEDGQDEGRVLLNGTEVYFIDADQLAWQQHSLDLLSWQNQPATIRFHYLAGGVGPGGAGWYLDDVAVVGCYPPGALDFSASTKTAPAAIPSGSTLTYTISIHNSGLAPAAGATLLDPLPAGAVYVPGSASGGATYNPGLNRVEWLGDVAAGSSVTVSFLVTATLPAGLLTNTAAVGHPLAATTIVTAATTVLPAAYPDVALAPAALQSTQYANQLLTHTLAISNTGNATLHWTIGEAPANCAAPGSLPWAGASPASGTTAPAGGSLVAVLFDSIGLAPGPYTGSLCLFSDDPDEGQLTVPLTLTVEAAADIAVSPPALSATQPANTTVTQTFQIGNGGDSPLHWTIDEETSAASPVPCNPAAVPWAAASPAAGITLPGDTTLVNVTFDSTGLAPGAYTAALCLTSDDPDEPTVRLPLALTVTAAPAAAVNPAALASTQPPDTTVTATLTLSNTGAVNLNWTITTDSGGDCLSPDNNLPWVGVSPIAGVTAPASASQVVVTFNSTGLAPGVYTGVLCINTDDPINPIIAVPLTLVVSSRTIYLPIVKT